METIKFFRDLFKKGIEKADDVRKLPAQFLAEIITYKNKLTDEQYKEAVRLIGDWVRYTRQNNFEDNTDPVTIRYHLQKFAELKFGKKEEPPKMQFIEVKDVVSGGKIFSSLLSQKTDPGILEDPDAAIFGGVARLALKMHVGVDISSELPINDVDVILKNTLDINQKLEQYGLDLASTRVVSGDLLSECVKMATNVDCSMNEVVICRGILYFTQRALEDIKTGAIRVVVKDDPLFGSEGYILPNGESYLEPSGFYRTLSFLLRGKGDRIVVSKENIEQEKDNIGRYWLVILFVKLMKMSKGLKRDLAVINWYLIAKQIGSTEAASPLDFLKELLDKYPTMRVYKSDKEFNIEKQMRWLVGKLTSNSVEILLNASTARYVPETYSPVEIRLLTDRVSVDLEEFWNFVEKLN